MDVVGGLAVVCREEEAWLLRGTSSLWAIPAPPTRPLAPSLLGSQT